MKKVLSLASAFLFVGVAGIALSQTDNSAPAASTVPAVVAPKAKATHPLLNEIRARIEAQNERIGAGVKDKKITKDQAKAFHEKIKAVREELQKDLKTTGTKELADDQFQQLKQELDDNSTAIKGAKTAGDDNAAPTAATTPAAK